MSRIHEALQRAYLERGRMPIESDLQVAEPDRAPIPSEFTAEPVVKPEIDIDKVARHAWTPSLTSLPTLANRGSGVEQFRGLRSNIYQARHQVRLEAPLKTILIGSGVPSEGKSIVAANLAISLARNSIDRILLIDGDLRRPSLHTLLGAPNSVGLSDYLEGDADIYDILQRDIDRSKGENRGTMNTPNLALIPSGKPTDHSTELVAGERMRELIASVSPNFDWIIIDAPPVLAATDAVEISRVADAVLLVARGAITTYEVAQHAQAAFGNLRILGFVLNDVTDPPKTGAYGYNYSYHYHSDSDDDARGKSSKGNEKQ